MSAGRLFPIVVFLFWLASMVWLIQTKVIPLTATSPAPLTHNLPPVDSLEPLQESWQIQWNDQRIGSVRSRAFRDVSQGQVDVMVTLEDAPADDMLNEFFGPANYLIKLATRDLETDSLDLRVTSTMFLDYAGRLERFSSRLFLGGIGNLFQLEGSVTGTTLQVNVHAVGEFWPEGFPTNLLSRDFELPAEAFVSDAFAPPAELTGLSVGRSWQYHTYRALSPNQPMQRIQATVEAVETIGWRGQDQTTLVVVLRDVGNDLSATDDVMGKMWVRSDGTVLRQSLRFGNLEIDFRRDDIGGIGDIEQPRENEYHSR